MDPNNPVVKLCIQGTQAEYQGLIEQARACYRQAWEIARNDYEACVAAHYVARHQEDPRERLRWNQVALDRASACADEGVREFFPSLYLNMGQSYEFLGNEEESKRYYDLAAGLGLPHQPEELD